MAIRELDPQPLPVDPAHLGAEGHQQGFHLRQAQAMGEGMGKQGLQGPLMVPVHGGRGRCLDPIQCRRFR